MCGDNANVPNLTHYSYYTCPRARIYGVLDRDLKKSSLDMWKFGENEGDPK